MGREWSEERKEQARLKYQEKHAVKKATRTMERIRIPVGARRDITAVRDCPDGYRDRWVNDKPGRIDKFKQAGYENVGSANVGDDGVDGTHAESGVVSRDMGQGVTAYLMRQRMEHFQEDKTEKQRHVDETENSIRRKKTENSNDEFNGEINIGRQQFN